MSSESATSRPIALDRNEEVPQGAQHSLVDDAKRLEPLNDATVKETSTMMLSAFMNVPLNGAAHTVWKYPKDVFFEIVC